MGKVEVNGMLAAAAEMRRPLIELRQLALSFDGLSAENERLRREMVGVSDRAIRQVSDLMKIEKLEEGIFDVEPVAVRLVCDEVMQEVCGMFRVGSAVPEVAVKYSSRAKVVTANRELLKSVIYNFVLNSLNYAGEMGRTELSVRDIRGRVRVAVRDYGPALPTDVWETLQSGAVEQPTAIAMRPGSSALGLYIASKFSKYMNAEVGAVRHRDGTSFFVTLPAARQLRLFE